MSQRSDEPGRYAPPAATRNPVGPVRYGPSGSKTGRRAGYLIGGLGWRAADRRSTIETATRSGTRRRRLLVSGAVGLICAFVGAALPATRAWAASSPVLHTATYVNSGVILSYSD